MSATPKPREIIRAMRAWARTMRDSFVHRIGPDKGRITEPHIVREIACINEGIAIIQRFAKQQKGQRVNRKS